MEAASVLVPEQEPVLAQALAQVLGLALEPVLVRTYPNSVAV